MTEEDEGEWLEVRDMEGWKTLVGNPDSAKKFFDQDWIKSLLKEVADYDKLVEMDAGVKEVQGLQVEVSKGTEKGKYYFQARVIGKGLTVKVYDDNVTILSYLGLEEKLEEFRALKIDMKTILMRDYLKKQRFFEKLKPGREVKVFESVGKVKERGDDYAIVEFRANTDKGVVVSEVKINPARTMVNGRTIVGVKEGDDGGMHLLYKERGEVLSVPIRSAKRYR